MRAIKARRIGHATRSIRARPIKLRHQGGRVNVPIYYMKLGTDRADSSPLGISVPSLRRSAAERSYSARAALCFEPVKSNYGITTYWVHPDDER